MAIQIYNTLTKKKEELIPQDGKTIKMYACGVTVYDVCHIGHARSLYVFDMMRRYLQYRNYDVNFVRNITDVDDKIIHKSNELKKSFESVVEENIAAYRKDLERLGVRDVDQEPRATENIEDMIKDIEALIAKGFAYAVEGDVYYNVRHFKTYGKLSGQSIEKMQEAVRIEADEKKQDPLDFALWKKSKEGEPSWDSPWGKGRPGWHIECSCMSRKFLKCETLDIHAGGRDLVFPHHENEIAQAEPLTGKPFAKYWIHHGLLTINGQKMAKSLGNFITIEDALKKYSVNQLKMFYLSSHYASPVDFTEGKMQEAAKALERVELVLRQLDDRNSDSSAGDIAPEILEKRAAFTVCMDDDFNTPRALAVLFDVVHLCNKVLAEKNDEQEKMLQDAHQFLNEIIDIFGLEFVLETTEDALTEEMQDLLAERIEVRKNKDFQRSDELRDILHEKGVAVEDTKDGQKWRTI